MISPRAVLYLRLSAVTDDSTSIVRQERDLREHATRRGWKVVDVLIDNGVSGRKSRANAARAVDMLASDEADALAALDVAAALPTPTTSARRGVARARATADVLRDGGRGAASWLRMAAEAARDALPELTDDELPQRTATPRPPAAPTNESRQARRVADAARRHGDEAELAAVLERWLPRLDADELPLPAVWDAWQTALADLDPGKGRAVRRVGRTRFYAVLGTVRPIRSTGARRRVVTIRPA